MDQVPHRAPKRESPRKKENRVYSVDAPVPLLEFLLARVNGQSRNSVKHLLSRGQVLVDGAPRRQFDLPLVPGQSVTLLPQAKGPALPFPILYEDDGLLVIDKPAGLLTVAAGIQRDRTAWRLTADFLRGRDERSRLFLVHRLDRDTSGVLLFSKDQALRDTLQENWNALVKRRRYVAITEGETLPDHGVCRSQLTENAAHRVYSIKGGQGKQAVTRYRVLRHRNGYSLLDVEIETGRKNQIRAHLSELGCPVAGDEKYGSERDPLGRLALHAVELALTDPRSGRLLSFSSPVPQGFHRMFPGKW